MLDSVECSYPVGSREILGGIMSEFLVGRTAEGERVYVHMKFKNIEQGSVSLLRVRLLPRESVTLTHTVSAWMLC